MDAIAACAARAVARRIMPAAVLILSGAHPDPADQPLAHRGAARRTRCARRPRSRRSGGASASRLPLAGYLLAILLARPFVRALSRRLGHRRLLILAGLRALDRFPPFEFLQVAETVGE